MITGDEKRPPRPIRWLAGLVVAIVLGPMAVATFGTATPAAAASYPNGVDMNRIVYVIDQTGTFGLIDADGSNPGTVQAYPAGASMAVGGPMLSPDGTKILFSQEPDRCAGAVLRLSRGLCHDQR
jgi:hypothetical protein